MPTNPTTFEARLSNGTPGGEPITLEGFTTDDPRELVALTTTLLRGETLMDDVPATPPAPLTAEYIRGIFHYDPETGLLTRTVRTSGRSRTGTPAGSINADGYRVVDAAGRKHYVHRLIWLYVFGCLPPCQIDHINGDKADNRLCNLREASNAQNSQNKRTPGRHNKSSCHLGVSWDKQRRKWVAMITLDGKRRHLGAFDAEEDAAAAYVRTKREMHPFGGL